MIDQHTAETLEFPKVIAKIAGECLTPYGRAEVESFTPLCDVRSIVSRQDEIAQMKDIINFGLAFPLYRLEDCREILDKVQIEGVFLDPHEIRVVLELIEISISLHRYDQDNHEKFPAIAEHLKNIRSFPELKKQIVRSIDEDGSIKDSASPQLRRLRAELHDCRRRIITKLENILSHQRKQAGWQDDVITQRNDRYVIPVIAGQYKANQGILHDRSQSGATFYVEPNETVELNNRVNLLKQEERAEIVRILQALTADIAQEVEALRENVRLIGRLDAVHAAAGFARDTNSNRPVVESNDGFEIVNARHPLLILQLGGVEKVVPMSLRLDKHRRAVIITGPNTGGKTIGLKTVGLAVLMAQTGLLIPADETSRIGVFKQVFADIGDEQSIEMSLSTFSSHIRNIAQAVASASTDTLVLLDEIGVGTDPKEGSALAEAIILDLVEKGAQLVTTTHYSQLKTLALDYSEIENASLEFNRETLAPTYRLQMGIPGASYAVEIAGRLGIPTSICERASKVLGSGERSLAELIASLEKELHQVREDRIALTERLAKAETLEKHYREELDKFEREIDESRREALGETDHLLEDSRKQIERLVAEIRRTQADKQKIKEVHHYLQDAQEKAKRIRRKHRRHPAEPVDSTSFEKGDPVRIISLNREGEIDEVIGTDKARVRVGAVNTVVKLRDLEKLARKSKSLLRPSGGAIPDTGEMSPEIHLRGMTSEEAIEALDQFLDRAVIAGIRQVYVVHGKGTGALRRTLTDYLKKHPEVDSLRLGNWNEGGSGVTIVKLKS